MIEQVASALDAAHDRDLIHRDVKPSNILIAEPSEHVYLTDFGVAKQTTAPDLTRTGIFIGTIEYAAPEQIEGLTLDRRADVYALGCVLYECLAGRPPFEREAEVAVMHAHLTSPPPRLTDARPDLPKDLDRVIARAMAKSRDERFGTTPELIDAVHAVLRRSPAASSPPLDRHDVPVIPVEAGPSGESAPVAESVLPPEPAAPAVAEADVPVAGQPSAPAPEPAQALADPAPQASAPVAPPPHAPPSRRAPSLPRWGVTAILVALAALVSGTVAYIVARGDGETAAATTAATSTDETVPEAPLSLAGLVPGTLWKNCAVQNEPTSGATESAVCLQPTDVPGQNPPDRWQLSIYPDAASLQPRTTQRARGAEGPERRALRRDVLGWIGPVGPRGNPAEARRAPLLLFRRRRRGHRLDARAARAAEPPRHPRRRTRGRHRSRRALQLVALLAPPDRQGRELTSGQRVAARRGARRPSRYVDAAPGASPSRPRPRPRVLAAPPGAVPTGRAAGVEVRLHESSTCLSPNGG